MSTLRLKRTQLTMLSGESDLNRLVVPLVDDWSPTPAFVSLGADGVFVLPIDGKLAGVNSLVRVGLPFDILGTLFRFFILACQGKSSKRFTNSVNRGHEPKIVRELI